jgi:hypothetical protein
MNRHLIAAACLFAACATTETTKQDTKAVESTTEKMLIGNVLPFDLAACGPRSLELMPATTEVVLGALLSLGPAFQECFVDAKAVDGTALDARLKANVGETVSFEVTGTGVSASGKACLIAAAKKLPFKPLERGAKPLVSEVPVRPVGKSVVFGINSGSDAAGTVRLAQPSLCECYAEVATQPAPPLAAKVILTKDKPAEFIVEPNDESTLPTCVLGKLQALSMPAVDAQVPLQFLLFNSYASTPTEGAPAALQFQQYDGARNQRTADVLMLAGKRGSVASAYDAVVAKYKASRAPALIGELRTKCAAVLAADDAWLGGLRGLVGVYEASLKLVSGEKGKDAAWVQVEQALTSQLSSTNAEVARVEAQKKVDEGACPKSK